ncbi:uncharacterized protein LOC132268725 [Cornus florida]|uniref:uncharacterized protein LOC132268725 n=1 Tax=Cornus florida TaxID=4283 RepID=UPI002896F4F8|nr:uncharacterized protein LOC132268725 [Cornus florida]
MQQLVFPIPSDSHPSLLYFQAAGATNSITYPLNLLSTTTARSINPIPSSSSSSSQLFAASSRPFLSKFRSSNLEGSYTSFNDDDDDDADDADSDTDTDTDSFGNSLSNHKEVHGVEIELEKIGKNSCRIRSKIAINASLETVWNILTDYERLADFIPGLALSQLLEKRDNFARLLQIGQQNLAFGLKFNAKGIVDCYEKDLESLPFGQRRDIEFKMIEGDFQLFEGKWSIEQCNMDGCKGRNSLVGQQFYTNLAYVVDVEPKLWLPVRLVEGRLCREIKGNLLCIREEARKAMQDTLPDQYVM